MKRLSFLLVGLMLFLNSAAVQAQTVTVKGGINLSKFHTSHPEGYKMKPGAHLGAVVDFPIYESISLETGLMLSTKGSNYHQNLAGMGSGTDKVDLLYLNIPIHARSTFRFGGVNFFGTAGPYIGYGLIGRGKSIANTNLGTITATRKIEFGSESRLRRFDFGVGIGAGVELNQILVSINYDYGLVNLSTLGRDSQLTQNRVLSLSVGYRFRSK